MGQKFWDYNTKALVIIETIGEGIKNCQELRDVIDGRLKTKKTVHGEQDEVQDKE